MFAFSSCWQSNDDIRITFACYRVYQGLRLDLCSRKMIIFMSILTTFIVRNNFFGVSLSLLEINLSLKPNHLSHVKLIQTPYMHCMLKYYEFFLIPNWVPFQIKTSYSLLWSPFRKRAKKVNNNVTKTFPHLRNV